MLILPKGIFEMIKNLKNKYEDFSCYAQILICSKLTAI